MAYHLTVLVRAKTFIDRLTKILPFRKKCKKPMAVQWAFLKTLLKKHQDTEFGRKYQFASIHSIQDYQEKVPVHTWETLTPYVEEVKRGNLQALFPPSDKLIMFAQTSGNTGTPKYIPITEASYQFFKKYWDHAWTLAREVPWTADGKVLYFPGDPEEGFFGDVPFGAMSAKGYSQQNRLLRSLYAYPYQVCRIKDFQLRYYTIMRMAVENRITAVAIANPSTLLTLFRVARERALDIIEDIRTGRLRNAEEMPEELTSLLLKKIRPNKRRADELKKIYEKTGDFLPRHYWDHPIPVTCFASGPLKIYLKQLEEFHDRLYIYDLGLIASEGRFSFPVASVKNQPGCCLALETNFFEFIPEDEINKSRPRALTLDQCEIGKRYFIIITNYAGLYRYHISDLVEVTGFLEKVPLITFCNKGNNFSSITGEKLTEFQVTESVRKVGEKIGYPIEDFIVCLHWDDAMPSYSLLKGSAALTNQETLRRFISLVDEELMRMNIEYRAKRQSMRLGPLTLKIIQGEGFREYEKKKQQSNSNLSQYKHVFLIADPDFERQFQFSGEIASSVDLSKMD